MRRVCLRKGKEVHISAQEQSACAACFHLGMGGRGGAPRVAERQESPLKPEPAWRWLARRAPCCWHALDRLLPGRQHRFRGSPPWCSAEQDLARLLSLLHTPVPAAPPSYSLRRSGAWDLRLEPAAAARMESSGLFKSTLNIHRSKNKRASHSPRSLLRDPQG